MLSCFFRIFELISSGSVYWEQLLLQSSFSGNLRATKGASPLGMTKKTLQAFKPSQEIILQKCTVDYLKKALSIAIIRTVTISECIVFIHRC